MVALEEAVELSASGVHQKWVSGCVGVRLKAYALLRLPAPSLPPNTLQSEQLPPTFTALDLPVTMSFPP